MGAQLDTAVLGLHTLVITADGLSGKATTTITYTVTAPAPAVTAQSLLVTGLAQSTARWRTGKPKQAGKTPFGTSFSFNSDAAAQLTFKFSRAEQGRKNGRRCVPLTAHNAGHPKCTRLVNVGSKLINAVTGPNRVRFDGVIAAKALAPGNYVLTLTSSSAGSQPTLGTLRFTIVK
jgi:hypothetical protein